ncbi:MAG: AmmeMemoRadiSam system radical SAM enzyme [Clostridia bacterium]|jgi:pyruvate formate lyase activating enzyme|nr:AmmeMemoRadiSam system radical SAM enzyme [Clostridia bacterium]MBT7121944.1 AmmeMemoRadiSam system radical SAM enzyme [Clostridia bacterium]
MSTVTCEICPHSCKLKIGQTGLCRARSNIDGSIIADNYGRITAMALDPIEKKPLRRFHPGSYILSVGSFGCNLTCSFCQNHHISMSDFHAKTVLVSPEELVRRSAAAQKDGNIGIAFTYNEPLVGYEYVRDCAIVAKQFGQKIVLVTNGYINVAPLLALLPYVHAMNIDLKAFNDDFYKTIGGDLQTVKRTIALSAAACHVEVTTLIIPGENDSEQQMRDMAAWLADIDPQIPLHVARFFPQYNMTDRPPTNLKSLFKLAAIAREHLQYVYEGNC